MQRPREEEHEDARQNHGQRMSSSAKPEVHGIEEDLQHEVFPVDVDASPAVGKARGKKVQMMRLGQPEAKQVKHADDQMKLARDAQVEKKRRDQELNKLLRRVD